MGNIVGGFNAITGTTNPADDHGHGTHVAGIAAAVVNNSVGVAGVAGGAKIMPVKVLGSNGYGYSTDIIEGIIWVADNGADVINLSLGMYDYSQAIQDAVNYAYNKGIVIVAAAGNDNISYPSYPAACSNVISVAAIRQNLAKASFSNYGSTIDIAAPGENIYSTTYNGSYGYMNGTSMASPFVAGVAALILSTNPAYTPNQVETLITSTAIDLGTTGRDDVFGAGLVNVSLSASEIEPEITFESITKDPFIVTGTATTQMNYRLSSTMNVTFNIYNSSGTLVKTLVNNERKINGVNSAVWDGKNSSGTIVANGVYTYKMVLMHSIIQQIRFQAH